MKLIVSDEKQSKPWDCFEQRIRSARQARMILPFVKIPDEEKSAHLNSLFEKEPVTSERVIYVHIPFCKSLCPFCIYSKQVPESGETVKSYCETLVKQIQSVSTTVWAQSAPFKAIFFGGGTPTTLSAGQLTAIVRALKKHYPLAPDCEITAESTISEITPELCSKMKEAGVTRVSLGVQSFNTEIRKKLGRAANTEKILESLNILKDSGFSNVAIDLIYMLEGQNMETWKHDLQLLSDSPITGCSVYPLIAKPGSNNTKNPGNIELEYNYFIEADNFLPTLEGWQRFTPVQYGHSVSGKAAYVTSHGKNSDLLAFGAGAGGRIQNYMYLQNSTAEEFIKNGADLPKSPVIAMHIDERFLGLRKIYGLSEGLQLKKTDYEPIAGKFDELLNLLIQKDLVTEKNGFYQLTQSGRFWAGNISALLSKRIKYLISEK